jgi:hypothetical protein
MIKTFTQTDLIRYLYHETTEEESREIEAALLCDATLRSQYLELQGVLSDLDAAQLEPSNEVVANILNRLRSKVEGA